MLAKSASTSSHIRNLAILIPLAVLASAIVEAQQIPNTGTIAWLQNKCSVGNGAYSETSDQVLCKFPDGGFITVDKLTSADAASYSDATSTSTPSTVPPRIYKLTLDEETRWKAAEKVVKDAVAAQKSLREELVNLHQSDFYVAPEEELVYSTIEDKPDGVYIIPTISIKDGGWDFTSGKQCDAWPCN